MPPPDRYAFDDFVHSIVIKFVDIWKEKYKKEYILRTNL